MAELYLWRVNNAIYRIYSTDKALYGLKQLGLLWSCRGGDENKAFKYTSVLEHGAYQSVLLNTLDFR